MLALPWQVQTSVLERKRIESLPTNGRAITVLLQTVPGVETGMMRAYGMRQGTMLYVFDGTQHNESWEGWAQQRPPGIDAVEGFKVEINGASAKFSRPATLIVSSRSGTNQFHGALFETNRNSPVPRRSIQPVEFVLPREDAVQQQPGERELRLYRKGGRQRA